jgi:hypothetical protein
MFLPDEPGTQEDASETRCLTFPDVRVFDEEVTLATLEADGIPMVREVTVGARLPVSTFVTEGSVVSHVNGVLLEADQDLHGVLGAAADDTGSFTVTFMLPPPPMLAHGWARNIPRGTANDFTEDQQTFLLDSFTAENKITAAALRE